MFEPKRQGVDHCLYETMAQSLIHTLNDRWAALIFEARSTDGGEFDITVYNSHTPDVELPKETIEMIKSDCVLIRSATHWVTQIKVMGLQDW